MDRRHFLLALTAAGVATVAACTPSDPDPTRPTGQGGSPTPILELSNMPPGVEKTPIKEFQWWPKSDAAYLIQDRWWLLATDPVKKKSALIGVSATDPDADVQVYDLTTPPAPLARPNGKEMLAMVSNGDDQINAQMWTVGSDGKLTSKPPATAPMPAKPFRDFGGDPMMINPQATDGVGTAVLIKGEWQQPARPAGLPSEAELVASGEDGTYQFWKHESSGKTWTMAAGAKLEEVDSPVPSKVDGVFYTKAGWAVIAATKAYLVDCRSGETIMTAADNPDGEQAHSEAGVGFGGDGFVFASNVIVDETGKRIFVSSRPVAAIVGDTVYDGGTRDDGGSGLREIPPTGTGLITKVKPEPVATRKLRGVSATLALTTTGDPNKSGDEQRQSPLALVKVLS